MISSKAPFLDESAKPLSGIFPAWRLPYLVFFESD